jgi:hypothetical protein
VKLVSFRGEKTSAKGLRPKSVSLSEFIDTLTVSKRLGKYKHQKGEKTKRIALEKTKFLWL